MRCLTIGQQLSVRLLDKVLDFLILNYPPLVWEVKCGHKIAPIFLNQVSVRKIVLEDLLSWLACILFLICGILVEIVLEQFTKLRRDVFLVEGANLHGSLRLLLPGQLFVVFVEG